MDRRQFCAAIGGLAIAPTLARATQPAAPRAQPDRLPLGTLRVGAAAEASILVFADGDKAVVNEPLFMAITAVTKGNMNGKVYHDITLAIDTSKTGNFSGQIAVGVGAAQVFVPVEVNVLPDDPTLTRVLVADTPYEKFSTGDGSTFDAWTKVVDAGRLNPSYLLVDRARPVLRDLDLSRFDVVLLGCTGMASTTDADVKRLHKFVASGGRVVLTADRFYRGTVDKANEVMAPFGLRMDDVEPQGGPGKMWEVQGGGLRADPLTAGVRSLSFFRPSPITAQGAATILAQAEPYPGQGFVAVAQAGAGEVVAVGQSLWWSWITPGRANGADNARLLQNLLTRPRKASAAGGGK